MRFRPSLVLRRSLDAAVEALKRLEPGQVPASLRSVVKASGLTPPLEARLVRELDALPWLREKALAEWPKAVAALTADGPDRASAMFLIRPEGWSVELLELGWELGAAVGGAAGEKTSRDAAAARIKHNEAKDRLREAIRERDELRRTVRELERSAATPGRVEQQGAVRRRELLAESDAAREQERAEWAGRLAAKEAEAKRLRLDLQKARQEKKAAIAHFEEPGRPTWAKGGAELARAIDSVAAAAVRITPDNKVVKRLAPLRLPKGVRPDGAEAVDLVLDHRGPTHLVVDGYNVGLALASGKAAEVRARLDPLLGRMRTIARPPRSVTVVYDSSREGSKAKGVAGVAVRFAPPGTTADDVIVGLAGIPGTVVISNDREVRERAERAGALALWAEALVAWAKRR
ncbi:MAG: NYN domain-containing protein [Actinomycetota bacterium]